MRCVEMTNAERLRKMAGLEHFLSTYAVQWMIDKGFTTAPASTRYHGCYDGGLFDHSMRVLHHLLRMTRKLSLHWDRVKSPYIIAMMHDLCKVDQYVKLAEPIDGKLYEYAPTTITGHGSKSLIYAESIIKLTDEERACILHHMGAFGTDEEKRQYSDAVKQYPNVLWTHTADMLASQVDEM